MLASGCAFINEPPPRREAPEAAGQPLLYARLLEGAESQLELGDAKRAEELATRATTVYPERPEAFRTLGKALAHQGHATQAAQQYERARALGGFDQGLALELADGYERADLSEKALQTLRSYLVEHPDDVRVLRRLAQFWLRRNGHKQAVDVLREALLREPDHIESLQQMGQALLGAGQPRDAAAALERALLLDVSRSDTLRLLAQAHEAGGDRDKALVALDRALHMSSRDSEALRQRGRVRAVSGDWRGAMDDYAQLAAISNEPEAAWRDLETIAKSIDDERLMRAAAAAHADALAAAAGRRHKILGDATGGGEP